jgi:glyoxylase-like metal-dependent hydrolase (beta-lactamase superfamily II)
MDDLEPGIRRVTFRLPLGIDHVHCYFLRSSVGGWILVDTGLGTRDPAGRWQPVLDALDAPIERIVVTHMHPDHVGGAADIAGLTGAPVFQGREDYDVCRQAWGPQRDPGIFAQHWVRHGMPEEAVSDLVRESADLGAAVHWVDGPQLLDPGDEVDGWRVEVLRGHSDGHIVLVRDGVLIAGDTILEPITPAIGIYPRGRPDPLGDYFETLQRIEELDPRIAYAGHGTAIERPAERARAIAAHHGERLDRAESALDGRPLSAYDVSLELFPSDLSTMQRRFAVAEALAHLVRLVRSGRAAQVGDSFVAT